MPCCWIHPLKKTRLSCLDQNPWSDNIYHPKKSQELEKSKMLVQNFGPSNHQRSQSSEISGLSRCNNSKLDNCEMKRKYGADRSENCVCRNNNLANQGHQCCQEQKHCRFNKCPYQAAPSIQSKCYKYDADSHVPVVNEYTRPRKQPKRRNKNVVQIQKKIASGLSGPELQSMTITENIASNSTGQCGQCNDVCTSSQFSQYNKERLPGNINHLVTRVEVSQVLKTDQVSHPNNNSALNNKLVNFDASKRSDLVQEENGAASAGSIKTTIVTHYDSLAAVAPPNSATNILPRQPQSKVNIWSIPLNKPKTCIEDLLSHRLKHYIGTDCTIRIGDFHYRCHKFALEAYCVFFRDKTEYNDFDLPTDRVTPMAFQIIYEWMTNKDPLCPKIKAHNVYEILSTALYLGIDELVIQCHQIIHSREEE